MKKLFVLALSLAMVLSFAGCNQNGAGEKSFDDFTALEHYTALEAKNKEITSLEADYSAKMTISMMGTTMDMDMSGKLTQVIRSETDMDMRYDMTMGFMGQSISSNIYYIGGTMYMDTAGQKVQAPMDLGSAQEMAGMTGGSLDQLGGLAEMIKDSTMEDVEDGKKLILTMDPTKMSDMIDQLMGPMADTLGAGEDVEMAMNISELVYEIVVDREHNLKQMDAIMKMDITVEGTTMTCDMAIGTAYTGINTVTEITLPDDPESYTLDETLFA